MILSRTFIFFTKKSFLKKMAAIKRSCKMPCKWIRFFWVSFTRCSQLLLLFESDYSGPIKKPTRDLATLCVCVCVCVCVCMCGCVCVCVGSLGFRERGPVSEIFFSIWVFFHENSYHLSINGTLMQIRNYIYVYLFSYKTSTLKIIHFYS